MREDGLSEDEHKHLAQNLLKIKSNKAFGSRFELKLIDKDTINPFWLYIRCGDRIYQAKVTFDSYPSQTFPSVMFRDVSFLQSHKDDLGSTIGSTGNFCFNNKRFAGPFNVSDIIEIVLHYFRSIEHSEKHLNISFMEIKDGREGIFMPSFFNLGKSLLRLIGIDYWKGTNSLQRLLYEPPIKDIAESSKSTILIREELVKSVPWDIKLTRVIIFEELMRQIKMDARSNAPNEICFLASGVLTAEGNVAVCRYYGGEMDENSPCSCSLNKKFTEKIIYEVIPEDHQVIIWGHVHPIGGPSSLDCASLRELGKWDDFLKEKGPIRKRSLVMLINTPTFRVMFYDVKTEKKLPHIMTSISEQERK